MADMSVVAHPYARALFNLAKQQKEEAMWLEVLTTLDDLVSDGNFVALLNNPQVNSIQIAEVVKSVLKDKAYKDVMNFVNLLLENDRILAINAIRSMFHQLVLEDQSREDAVIESAYAMSEEEIKDFEQILTKKFGKKISARVELNPDLIGGIKITINDKVIDGSVRGRLQNLATELNN